ncbi:hypothetical protein BR93DRAFT_971788 [Coniochaeta sp. PMI_546]|nr:hypothetical protein BR93DRAFT_971788 [Coniochaeta sp. PMI_546]
MSDGQLQNDESVAHLESEVEYMFGVQKHTMAAQDAHWLKDLPFRDHFTRFAPTEPASRVETTDKHAEKKVKRRREPHLPIYLNVVEHTRHPDGTVTTEECTPKRPSPHCRCHSCVGARFQVFYLDLVVGAMQFHFENCMTHGTPCNILCPGQPTSFLGPASLTLDHLELAEQLGGNVNAVLTGVGFEAEYRPPQCKGSTSADGVKDLFSMLESYKRNLHGPLCTVSTPCRTWCFKRADQLTPDEIKDAKEKFPEWQRRMLASEGMALAIHNNMVAKKQKKADEKKRKKKMSALSKAQNQWSEAPFELAAFLGVYPRFHKPTCCREYPCVSLCVCFPEEAAAKAV